MRRAHRRQATRAATNAPASTKGVARTLGDTNAWYTAMHELHKHATSTQAAVKKAAEIA